MFYYNQYVRAKSIEEAYELYQKKSNVVLGGMLWLKMMNKTCGTAIDLCDLGLDQIEEDETQFRIGAYVSLRELETNKALDAYTHGAMAESVRHIVGVQFRNVATLGGSIWGRYGFSDVMTLFRALGAKVELHHGGIMDLDEFVELPRKVRDILVAVIVPKQTQHIVYLSQRNQSTDFPVLTCAVAQRADGYVAVIGAAPRMAQVVPDAEGILDQLSEVTRLTGTGGLSDDPSEAGGASVIDPVKRKKIEDFAAYTAAHVRFGSNLRAGADYRRIICQVLVRRALEQIMEQMIGQIIGQMPEQAVDDASGRRMGQCKQIQKSGVYTEEADSEWK